MGTAGNNCGQAEMRNPGATICKKLPQPLSHTPQTQAVLTGAQGPPGQSNLQELKWGMNGREAWECARLFVPDSVLRSSHHLSHILIKLSMENSETLDEVAMGTGSWVLLRWGEEFHVSLSILSV